MKDPMVLLKSPSVFPTENQTYEEKMNAVARCIILVTCLGCFLTNDMTFFIVGVVSIILLTVLYIGKKGKERFIGSNPHSFSSVQEPSSPLPANPVPNDKNPMNNVMVHELQTGTKQKPSLPLSHAEITTSAKSLVQHLNPSIKDTDTQLYGGLFEKMQLDQSMQRYYTTPNTQIPNDQGAFADFLYGNMPSCKDGNGVQCMKDNYRYTN